MSIRFATGILFSLLLSTTVAATPIGGLYVFGDSLSDPGNNAVLFGSTASPPFNVTLPSEITSDAFVPTYPYAASYQYSNGNVWAYQFATMLGLPAQMAGPVLRGGLGANYAFGGATTGPLNNMGVPSLLTQTADFITSLGATPAPSDALYVVAGGDNNARATLTAIAGGADPTATIVSTSAQFAADIGAIVDALQAKGAERIVVWDVADLVLAPAIAANGPAAASLATTLALSMNDALGLRLVSETGVDIFGLFGLLTAVNADPGAYGLTNATAAGGAIPGADVSTFLCWDGIHPTAAGHSILATSLYAFTTSVPEIDPAGSGCVIALVFGCVGWMERRRRASPSPRERWPSGGARSTEGAAPERRALTA